MSNASFFKVLGLGPKAPEAAVRSRFKILALAYHPDKTNAVNKQAATDRFVEIKHAYEYCMSHLDPEEQEEVIGEDDDEEDWRGKLPTGIFNANSEWWDELQGDEPRAILKLAEACQNALRFAAVELDEVEQRKLNADYLTAYENFEKWCRKHIEQPEEEERIEQDINALPERVQVHVRRALEAKRAAPDYTRDRYQEDHDEEQYFWEQDAIGGPPVMLTDTWRDNHNSVKAMATPQQHLELFRTQVKAVEKRNQSWVQQQIEYYNEEEKNCRRDRRNVTEARLVADVERAEKRGRVQELTKYMNSVKAIGPHANATAVAPKEETSSRSLKDSPEDSPEDDPKDGLEDGPKDEAS